MNVLLSLLHEGEVVKPVVGHDGYWITSHGRVFSNRSKNGKGTLEASFRELSQGVCSYGRYLRVSIDGKTRMTHRLVALAFIGEPPVGTEVSHKDGNSHNNRVDNLEYVTHRENERMKFVHGTKGGGELSTNNKLTQKQVDEIRSRLKNYKRGMLTALAKEYGVCLAAIHAIHKGKAWKIN